MSIHLPIHTPRLVLRSWLPADREPFAALNADARVMRYMPALLTRAESDAFADRIEAHLEEHGYGLFAAELRTTGGFVGFIGLSVPSFAASFMPTVEIGWRLAADCWNRGLATEGAEAVRDAAMDRLDLDEIVSFTVPENLASRRVMEKIGFTHDPADDFEHPRLPSGHPLRRHVLYRLRRSEWLRRFSRNEGR
ncbi:MAG: GNAT family N-acetyltransferase [Vicinamibacterales bacterium]